MLRLKPAAKSELALVQQMAQQIWQKHYVPIIGEAQVAYMLEKMYSVAVLTQQMEEEGCSFYFIEKNEEKLGYIAVSWKDDACLFIHKFYLQLSQHSQGIGTQAMLLLMHSYPQAKCFRLTVNRQNYKAINFYFKNGFVITSVEDFDIGSGYFMNDFVMELRR
ncbi:MAG: GNAT family N-acetyltransferase [Chitinophagales bacterium]|nr:GNAT family N-acetyltransferase [Bacteroidota bacterium]MCB9042329.1 GNAT family N-acetyltransferase [Chitinophagales bacterium]